MCKNFKILRWAAYILILTVSICRICGVRAYFQPNSVASAKIWLIWISAENMVQPAEFFEKILLRGLLMRIMFRHIFQEMQNFRNIVLLLSRTLVCALIQDVVI